MLSKDLHLIAPGCGRCTLAAVAAQPGPPVAGHPAAAAGLAHSHVFDQLCAKKLVPTPSDRRPCPAAVPAAGGAPRWTSPWPAAAEPAASRGREGEDGSAGGRGGEGVGGVGVGRGGGGGGGAARAVRFASRASDRISPPLPLGAPLAGPRARVSRFSKIKFRGCHRLRLRHHQTVAPAPCHFNKRY